MKLTKSELKEFALRLYSINNSLSRIIYIMDKTGEVEEKEIPDSVNVISIKMFYLTHELKVTFSPALPSIKLESIFRECYDQHNSCNGCRWLDSDSKTCIFQGRALDEWSKLIEWQGYELEDKLW